MKEARARTGWVIDPECSDCRSIASRLLPQPVRSFMLAGMLLSATGVAAGTQTPRRLDQGEPAALRALGDSLNLLGHRYRDGGQLDSAEWSYRRSLELRQRAGFLQGVAASTNNLGNVFLDRGQRDSAIVYYRRAIALNTGTGATGLRAMSLRNLGLAFSDSAESHDSARSYLARAASLFEAASDTGGAADAWLDIAELESAIGNHNAVVMAGRQALAFLRSSGDSAGTLRAMMLLGAAALPALRPDSARAYYREARTLASQIGDPAGEREALGGIAEAFKRGGAIDSALAYSRAALAGEVSPEDSARYADTYRIIAGLHRELGRLDSAQHYFRYAAAIQARSGDGGSASRTLLQLSNMYLNWGHLDSAASAIEAARSHARAAADTTEEMYSLLDRAALHWRLSLPGRLDRTQQLDAARATLDTAWQLLGERVDTYNRVTILLQQARMHWGLDSVLPFLRRAQALARGTTSEQRVDLRLANSFRHAGAADSSFLYFAKALQAADAVGDLKLRGEILQFMGYTLLERDRPDYRRAASYFDSALVVTEQRRARAGDDASRIAFAEMHARDEVSPYLAYAWGKAADEHGSLEERWRQLAALERVRARALVDLLRGDDRPPTFAALGDEAAALRRELSRRTGATLSYSLFQDTLTAFVTLPSGMVYTETVGISAEALAEAVAGLRRALRVDSAAVRAARSPIEEPGRGLNTGGSDQPMNDSTARERLDVLADLLLPKVLRDQLVESGASDLVIVPHGLLALVPFAALPFGDHDVPTGLRFALRYAPSLTALLEAEKPVTRGRKNNASPLVIGNPTMPSVTTSSGERQQLGPLSGAGREADSVAARLGTVPLTGQAATESAVRARMPGAPVIHLATHGYAYASDSRQRDSFIALAPDATHDGLLTVGEVLDLKARLLADLVVLSACQTGLGFQTSSEGTVGLQRAFLAKGARSLLVSLWSVDDAVTQRLMVRFYHHWSGGVAKAEALRLAQADVRRTHPSPRYWAPFQLVGAN